MDQTPRRRRRPDPSVYPDRTPQEPDSQPRRRTAARLNRGQAGSASSSSYTPRHSKPSSKNQTSPRTRFPLSKAQQRYAGVFIVSTIVLAICLYNVLSYGYDYFRSIRFSAELRNAYLSDDDDANAPLDLSALYADATLTEMDPQDNASFYAANSGETAPADAIAQDLQTVESAPELSAPAVSAAPVVADADAPSNSAAPAQEIDFSALASTMTAAQPSSVVAEASAAPVLADADAPSDSAAPTQEIDFSALASTMTATQPGAVATAPVEVDASGLPVSLPAIPYPTNPGKTISSRFTKIRRQNSEIIGWLTLEGLLSEAVVQRDNSYYLTRDYQGYHNVNGAIFLEERVDLSTRPYTLTLYGHNMKTGAMFGCLRNYEDIGYYRKNPFIEFDSIYEDGKYVIFAISEVSIDSRYGNYNGFFHLNSCSTAERKEIINGLFKFAEYVCPIDVSVEDQLLLLVTCVGEDSERRVLAARRFRTGETEGGLFVQAQKAHHR